SFTSSSRPLAPHSLPTRRSSDLIVPPHLPDNMNDNRIINALANLQSLHKERQIILVSKDINMRLKARACGVEAQDYHTDQLVDDIDLLPKGYVEFPGSFWDRIDKVETIQREGVTEHVLLRIDELAGLD